MTEHNTETFTKQKAGKLETKKGTAEATLHVTTAEFEASSLAANDTINLFRVPVGAKIYDVKVITDKLGSGTSLDVGDAVDGDRYIDGANTAKTGGVSESCLIDGIGFVTTAGTSDIVAKNLGGSATGTIKASVIYTV